MHQNHYKKLHSPTHYSCFFLIVILMLYHFRQCCAAQIFYVADGLIDCHENENPYLSKTIPGLSKQCFFHERVLPLQSLLNQTIRFCPMLTMAEPEKNAFQQRVMRAIHHVSSTSEAKSRDIEFVLNSPNFQIMIKAIEEKNDGRLFFMKGHYRASNNRITINIGMPIADGELNKLILHEFHHAKITLTWRNDGYPFDARSSFDQFVDAINKGISRVQIAYDFHQALLTDASTLSPIKQEALRQYVLIAEEHYTSKLHSIILPHDIAVKFIDKMEPGIAIYATNIHEHRLGESHYDIPYYVTHCFKLETSSSYLCKVLSKLVEQPGDTFIAFLNDFILRVSEVINSTKNKGDAYYGLTETDAIIEELPRPLIEAFFPERLHYHQQEFARIGVSP